MPWNAPMSPPLENTSPWPRTTTQRAELSCASAWNVAISSRCIGSSIALRADGFDRLTQTTLPSSPEAFEDNAREVVRQRHANLPGPAATWAARKPCAAS